ncbi:hypothetical protein BD324DRAFT_682822 [Kockovaella imperatae]|uniref:Uncharacterized protein n=1 Tax=Kockovaella imperatae TaxID=4999 RepID=A0A1Y1UCV1_9TREE|nr:hypothetical protein BD324DRAFT_682822 [Kockovaella imperatae]ORX34895.1 hypothetical protein BD324DRAFT_682822 [Kockovaella imperatae]
MFPVPDHLPKRGGAHLSSEDRGLPDPTLDLLDPLIDEWASSQPSGSKTAISRSSKIREVRTKLTEAIHHNKTNAHELLRANYPSISSHIRLGEQAKIDFGKISRSVDQLEKDIHPEDAEISFLPPLLANLDRHFAAVQAQAATQAQLRALELAKEEVGKLHRLEEAVWAGRGADEWVIKELIAEKRTEALELEGTRLYTEMTSRYFLLRSMVTEQLSDGLKEAISLATFPDGRRTLRVQGRATLPQPKLTRPEIHPQKSSKPPPYSLAHVYNALASFQSLDSILQNLQTRLLREIVAPVASRPLHMEVSGSDPVASVTLQSAQSLATPKERIDSVASILSFITDHVLPSSDRTEAVRISFLAGVQQESMRLIVQHILLPSMPSALSAIPSWLETVNHAVEVESQNVSSGRIIAPFFTSEAGRAWATQRRKRVAEDVRKLIDGGWGGWEAVTEQRDKEVLTLIEVEVSDGEDVGTEVKGEEPDEFGWGFDDQADDKSDAEGVDDGWGFDESENADAGPSKSAPSLDSSKQEGDTGDGWDFDLSTPQAELPPAPPPVAKPVREAKRLGKKVAKVANEAGDDPWASEGEKEPEEAAVPPAETSTADDWAWGDGEQPTKTRTKKKRKLLKEERQTIKETFLISRACEKIVDMADRALMEAVDLESKDLLSPSFRGSHTLLLAAASDVFDVYRSLLPTHFVSQVRDVPTLAMQMYNDAGHLAKRVAALQEQYPMWSDVEGDASPVEIAKRLDALAVHAFESQLALQKQALMEELAEARLDDVAREIGMKNAERSLQGVAHKIDTLSRVLKVVLPETTYLLVLGYLLDETIQKISGDILALQDITEVESTRLSELLRVIYPLEEIFVLNPGQPSAIVAQVPHWLKFCYISELLNANLVDILYLFDSGALIDFTTDELVRLIRALFADSEKRDQAIDKIEKGLGEAAE